MGNDNFFNEYIVQGGLTMLVLVPLSIYTFGLIIQKYLELRRSKIISQEIIKRAQQVSSQASFEEFYAFLKNKPTPLPNIVIGYIELGALVSAIDKFLITTMWGLFIAVPAYFFFSALQSKIFFFLSTKFFPPSSKTS